MNIIDYMPLSEDEWLGLSDPAMPQVWEELLSMRRITFAGFTALECDKGFLAYPTPLATSRGQEMARILVCRVMEEFMERHHANERAHVLEEGIDALNYAWSLALLDPNAPVARLAHYTMMAWIRRGNYADHTLEKVLLSIHPFLESLRNRAWQHNCQHQYFEGWDQLLEMTATVSEAVMGPFRNWEEFVNYYVAKDKVLQFRLRSQY